MCSGKVVLKISVLLLIILLIENGVAGSLKTEVEQICAENKNSNFNDWISTQLELQSQIKLEQNQLICSETIEVGQMGHINLFKHSGNLLFGFNNGNSNSNQAIENNLDEKEQHQKLIYQLLKEQSDLENSFWRPFLCELTKRFPIYNSERVKQEENTPAIFWDDLTELKGTSLKDRIEFDRKWFNEILQHLHQNSLTLVDYYDVVWAFSIVYAFSFPIYDGEKYQHVISPTFLLMKHDPLAETHFAYSSNQNTMRAWSDLSCKAGDQVKFYGRTLNTNDYVKLFGSFVNDNPHDVIYLDVYLDGNDIDYELKNDFLRSIGVLKDDYPQNNNLYIDHRALLSHEVNALLRLKYFKLGPNANRTSDLTSLFPDPFNPISPTNELSMMKELISYFSSKLEREYPTDVIQDIRLFERRSTLQNPKLRNALAARIVEKKLIVKANRGLVNASQRLSEELTHGYKSEAAPEKRNKPSAHNFIV